MWQINSTLLIRRWSLSLSLYQDICFDYGFLNEFKHLLKKCHMQYFYESQKVSQKMSENNKNIPSMFYFYKINQAHSFE